MTTEKNFDAARYAAEAAPAVGLTIEPAHLPGVLENLARIHSVAALFLDFPLPDEEEPAFVFVPSTS